MDARPLRAAFAVLGVFAALTLVVRTSVSHGGRESAWLEQQFGGWPAEVVEVQGSGHLAFSMVASYSASGTGATGAPTTVVPALFGHASVGSVVDSFDSGHINGSRFNSGRTAGQLSSLSVYVAGPVDAAPHDQFQLAIYNDSHGAPGRLLASTETGKLVPDAWNTLPIRAFVEPDTAYWLMYNTNGSNGAMNNLTYAPLSGSPLDTAIRSHHSASLVRQADRVSVIGNLTITAIAVMLLALVAARRSRRAALSLLIGFAAAMLLAFVLRETVFQPYAHYPSGHALRVAFVATGLAGLAPRWAVRVGGWFVVVLVSVAAVYAGRHYSEEVIGGVLLGWAAATSATALARVSFRSSEPASGAGPVRLLHPTESGPISSCGRSDRKISL